jgi:hypothetical protein
MIFQHTWQQVMDGTKTQTRRPVRMGEMGYAYQEPAPPHIVAVGRRGPISNQWDTFENKPYELKPGTVNHYQPIPYRFRLEQEHAIQPGRGKSGIGRIRITAIRREDVRKISDTDIKAEGFTDRTDFLRLWEQMHGSQYEAWVLTFELMEGAA